MPRTTTRAPTGPAETPGPVVRVTRSFQTDDVGRIGVLDLTVDATPAGWRIVRFGGPARSWDFTVAQAWEPVRLAQKGHPS